MGIVHGGLFATLDSALGCAVASILPAGKATEPSHVIVRPLSDKVPFVRAEPHHPWRQPPATADARLTGPDGRLYAHGSTTCFIFDAP
jgi:acyl-coenzyme A thioesterase PaaI-like protein